MARGLSNILWNLNFEEHDNYNNNLSIIKSSFNKKKYRPFQ